MDLRLLHLFATKPEVERQGVIIGGGFQKESYNLE